MGCKIRGNIIPCNIGDLYQLVDTYQIAEKVSNTKLFIQVGYYMIIQEVIL
jgi:hypothetical protein